ncbi:MAG: carboxypeptidase-like regulatory domain-containing protein [Flavobacteriaceae bacterium]|nr:carboxypeptidase-like regulatory domain-containing protein [Flavobacteriaceae bacterium]
MIPFKKLAEFRNLLIILTFFCFISCSNEAPGDSVTPNTTSPPTTLLENFGNLTDSDFMGRVVDLQNNPVTGAMVQISNSTTDTDVNGIFIIRNAEIYEKFAYVKVEKAGFLHGSRSVVPTAGINKIQIMLLPQTVTQTVSSGTAVTVSLSNGAAVDLSGSYSNSDGSDYTGDVQVTLHLLNPIDDDMQQQMPGMLLAENLQNEARMLETLGMVAVELRSDTGEKLNLSEGTTATISVPLDPETLAGAPNEIPLWYFDEENGYWVEEGSATLQGTKYVGTVSHFSFWNCDIPTEYVNICMNITDTNNTPLSNIQVRIESEFNGTGYGYTNDSGEVCGIIPANQTLNLQYFLYNICNNPEIPNSSETVGPFNQNTTLNVVLDAPIVEDYLETITGIFNNCDGDAVVNGYVQGRIEDGQWFYSLVTDGVFEINVLSCNENASISITGYDYDTLQTTSEINYTLTSPETDLGTLSACDSVEEFIQFSIDDGEVEQIVFNVSCTTYQSDFSGLYTLDIGGSNQNTCIYLSGALNDNYVNFEGAYEYGNVWNSNTPSAGMAFVECQDISEENNQIIFNLTSYGNTTGEYIDINFGGAYEDYQGVPHTITGVIHVKRDN